MEDCDHNLTTNQFGTGCTKCLAGIWTTNHTMDEWYAAIVREAFMPAKKPLPAGIIPDNPMPEGTQSVWELTLTTTKDDPYELRTALDKITKSNMYEIISWEACFELTKAGLPHIHAVLYSKKKYLDKSKIKALKFPYRYELARVRDLNKYLNYIKKESGSPSILNYCTAKGIPQFWDAIPQGEKAGAQATA